ncbi:Uncharacterised protein [Mycobacteroides abscessus subsp. abscessus]|uniref:phage upper tail fiber protein n=1 Tax=Mycobacteroides abscessus TaxID=36809 RepID=UPI000925C1EC|nr:hypothetical protein [Mycobacteroides abscessus]SKU85224.1 Uncharacterised protein [Mycobacteroides abscessus subsp. massiliense]SII65168.1 Uncharacterised protein [Mycobacteroides abscessus subsp. abscessus]SIJ99027.1 Uncharacterised protein [Mycobacteroides abscessus subsp. abscessus]SIL63185.1 Uncharacterised protein [Mycobacteroides abscessus subsp. abscessus]SKU94116.1 Uncharacterised protein [Mycobacteroides abscessus subsp. massiliense]
MAKVAQVVPYLDMSAPRGQRLAPEMREEIAEVAPSTLNDGAVKTAKLAEGAVTEPKLAAGAVTSPKIASKGVKAVNIDDAAVGTAQLAAGAVTAAKAGVGVVTAHDSAGNAIKLDAVPMTSTDYTALTTKEPNVLYLLSD